MAVRYPEKDCYFRRLTSLIEKSEIEGLLTDAVLMNKNINAVGSPLGPVRPARTASWSVSQGRDFNLNSLDMSTNKSSVVQRQQDYCLHC